MADESTPATPPAVPAPTRKRRRRDGEYEYRVPSSNPQGISVRAQCRITPELDRVLDEIIALRRWPLRLKGDLIRWGIESAARELLSEEGCPSVLMQAELIRVLMINTQDAILFEENFRKMQENIQYFLDRGEAHRARKLLWQTWQLIDGMPAANDFKGQYAQAFLQRYGGIMEGGKFVSADVIRGYVAGTVPEGAPPAQSQLFPDGEGEESGDGDD
jgi:hypothetical protein